MTLIERIELLCEKANEQDSRKEMLDETKRLAPLLKDAEQLSKTLEEHIDRLQLFRDQGFCVAVPDTSAAAQKTLNKLRERFTRDCRAEQLTRGNDWTQLIQQVANTHEELVLTLKTEWHSFIDHEYGGDSPDRVSSSLAHTEGNRRNLEEYKRKHSILKEHKRTLPGKREEFMHVRELARALSEIYNRFDFGVPDEVKRFLQAVAGGGADLELLTPTVRDWLYETDYANQYRIVARGGQ